MHCQGTKIRYSLYVLLGFSCREKWNIYNSRYKIQTTATTYQYNHAMPILYTNKFGNIGDENKYETYFNGDPSITFTSLQCFMHFTG